MIVCTLAKRKGRRFCLPILMITTFSTRRPPVIEKPDATTPMPCRVITEILANAYLRSEKDPWLRTIFSHESFGKQLRKTCPSIDKKDKISNDSAYKLGSNANWVYVYTIPIMKTCRDEFEKTRRVKIDWPEDVTDWDGDLTWLIDGYK
jgi:hypothetical protein